MTTTRYVNTASTAGGDGTTNATTGDNRAWASLSEAESNLPATLTDDYEVICEGSTADTTDVDINGITTTSSNFLKIKTDDGATNGRHPGYWSTTHYRLDTSAVEELKISEDYVRIEGLQFRGNHSSHTACLTYDSTITGEIQVSHCLFDLKSSTNQGQRGFYPSAGCTTKVWNCIGFADYATNTTGEEGIYFRNASHTAYCYNCTFVGFRRNIRTRDPGLSVTLKNVLCKDGGSQDFYFQSGTLTVDYCASSDGTATGEGGTGNRANQTGFAFEDASSDDYRLASGDTSAKDYGTDLSADSNLSFSDDIEGNTRSGSWDIGASEVVSGVSVTALTLAALQHNHTLAGITPGQLHNILLSALQHGHTLAAITPEQLHNLTLAALQHSQTLGAITVNETIVPIELILEALQHSHTLASVIANEIVVPIELVLEALQHNHTLATVTVGEAVAVTALTLAALQHNHTIDVITANEIIVSIALALEELSHNHSLDGVTLTQLHNLVLEELQHNHTLASTTVGASVVLTALTVAALQHNHTLDSLTVGVFHILTVDNLGHSHVLAGFGLSQFHELVVEALQHTHNLETASLNLSIAEGTVTIDIDFINSSVEIDFLNSSINIESLNGSIDLEEL